MVLIEEAHHHTLVQFGADHHLKGREVPNAGRASWGFKASKTVCAFSSVWKSSGWFDAVKGDVAPPGTPAYRPDRDTIAPRVSLAWSPESLKHKTLVRAGYGMYYGFRLNVADAPGLSYPIEPFGTGTARQALGQALGLRRPLRPPRRRSEGPPQLKELPAYGRLPHALTVRRSAPRPAR